MFVSIRPQLHRGSEAISTPTSLTERNRLDLGWRTGGYPALERRDPSPPTVFSLTRHTIAELWKNGSRDAGNRTRAVPTPWAHTTTMLHPV